MQFLNVIIVRLKYRWAMWRKAASEQYIREAFSYLTELDLDDFVLIPEHGIELKAWGNEVHIKVRNLSFANGYSYQCVIKEGIGRCVYVDEWRKKTREVILEFGSKHETHWWNVYRTGCFITSTRFIDYLKILYGGGPNVQKPKAAGVHVRNASAEEELPKRYGAEGSVRSEAGTELQRAYQLSGQGKDAEGEVLA